jgi:FKBP-type peptidyl-prolyl cis-trans isomerase
MLSRRLLPVPLVLLTLVVAGCGDDKTATEVSEATSTAATTATEATKTGDGKAPTVEQIAKGIGTDLDKAPEFIAMSGTPPKELIQEDIVEGDGKEAKLGDTIEVRYTLQVWDGQVADSSWTREPNSTSFPLVEGGLIEGWTAGIPGMKEGGRRLLIVPPEQGYGEQDQGPALPANSTLVFAVDLVKVTPGE